ncbi:MAG: 7-cyano-7-deazaguanine synthase QueC [Gammaproteobacteria bacterium]|nr:7-cyano-7-deazaguanine synthase QueC [Gammaproteobacteria bacterium]
MCAISGFIVTDLQADRQRIAEHYIKILERGYERGKDAAGVLSIDTNGVSRRSVQIYPQQFDFIYESITQDCSLLIANNQAELTTEYVRTKTEADVQPFGNGTVFVSHNGTIANDNELRQRYNIQTDTKIDSAVCPELIYQIGVENAIQEITGSFALAIADSRQPRKLRLARNYNPLVLQVRSDLGAIFFASLAEHLLPEQDIQSQLTQPPVISPQTYSFLEIDGDSGEISQETIAPRDRNKQALVICSGGLDSVTTAKWAQLQGYDITLLYFLYGCRAEKREMESVRQVAEVLGCDYRFEELNWLKKVGGSSLTDETISVTENETGAEFAHEWVPARNLIMTSLAAGLCDRYGYDTLVLGLNLEESGAYPDNTVEFYQTLDHVLNIGTTSRPRLLSPLANLVKHEIIKDALEMDAPIHLSWSCYHGNEKHCGQCGPCYMRRSAFHIFDTEDSVEYEQV